MFATIKQMFKPTNKDLRNRLLFTLAMLFVFKIGTVIRIPGTQNVTDNLGFLELINAMGGGALKQFSVFALGVMPYITASIIIELLSMDIIPYLSELGKQGYTGRQKKNQITRYIGIIFAFVQGIAYSFAFLGTGVGVMEYLRVATIMTAGTAFLLWIGDQITQKGIGNGTSLIIMAGILATIPTMFIDAFNELVKFTSTQAIFIGLISFIVFVIIYLLIIVGVIFVQEAERRLPIQYANRTTSSYGGQQNYMPLRINSAGVIPVIFASSIIAIPATIAQFVKNESFTLFVNKYLNYNTIPGFALYIALILFFAYFYVFLQINPEQLAENLQKNGGYIPGIKPGKDTCKYIKQVLSRLTVVGAIFLAVIAGLPIIFTNLSKLPSSITIGGTGLLIVVGVALETYKQLESSVVSRNYKKTNYQRRSRKA
ncbi:MAG: preprotein translocase subunit SecY [Firmicutes bacterium]|nr:preprotein translocase subunit SecY [Bacillota bacterium]